MDHVNMIDTFPAFLAFWKSARKLPVAQQIDAWANEYLAPWPQLLQMQKDDYASQGLDWREIARQRIFPDLDARLPAMQTAHANLLALWEPDYARTQAVLGFESEMIVIIHVGIGCGAGWVTTYDQKPAILFGLENIVEEGWIEPEVLRGLIAHEIGHVAHFHWRDVQNLPKGDGPWWQLYIEGFAMWCEHQVEPDSWHMLPKGDVGWLNWCRENRSWLAAEFLRRVDSGESVTDFFGSWFDIQGWRQTGYFLGHEVINAMTKSSDPQKIALLKAFEKPLRKNLELITS